MEGGSGVTRRIIGELYSRDIRRDQIQGEIGVSRGIIDELHSADIIKWKVKMV